MYSGLTLPGSDSTCVEVVRHHYKLNFGSMKISFGIMGWSRVPASPYPSLPWLSVGRKYGFISVQGGARFEERKHIARTLVTSVSVGPDALVDYVRQNQGKVDGVKVVPTEGLGYGLIANKVVDMGSQVVVLPRTCCLTYSDNTDQRLLSLIKKVPEELWGGRLALQVLAQRLAGSQSPFCCYIENLPVGVAGLPMFYTPDAIAGLQYPPVIEQVKKRCRWLLSFSNDVIAPVRGTPQDPFDGQQVDVNVLGWALGVVTSRAFRVRGPSQPAAMLPLIDLCNHSFRPNCEVKPSGEGGVQLVTLRQLLPGEPVLINYGSLPNDFLLMDYGFLMENNPHDTVQLRFDLSLIEAGQAFAGIGRNQQDLQPWQQHLLGQLNLVGPGAKTEVCLARKQPMLDPRLLAAVRIMSASDPGEVRNRGIEELGGWDKHLPAASEVRALRTLAGLCMLIITRFGTTLQEDEQLLASDQQGTAPLSADLRQAIRFRMEKKKVVAGALQQISGALQEIRSHEKEPSGSPKSSANGIKPGSRGSNKAPKGFG